MQPHQIDDRCRRRQSHGGARRRSKGNPDNRNFKRKDGWIRRQRIGDKGEAYRGIAPDCAVGGAPVFEAAAGGQGQGGEQEDRKKGKSFAALHVAPHDRVVAFASLKRKTLTIPPLECNAAGEQEDSPKAVSMFNC